MLLRAVLAAIVITTGTPSPAPTLPDKGALAIAQLKAERAAERAAKRAQQAQTALTAPAAPPAPAPAQPTGSVWDPLADCEWNENPAAGPTGWATTTTGNGYYTALQFSVTTFLANGGTQAELDQMKNGGPAPSRDRIIQIGINVQRSQGWGAWPHCAAVLGLY